MANRYWVGGTATWDATAGSKWATTDGGVGGAAVPTASDDVFFTAKPATTWAASTAYILTNFVSPVTGNGFAYECTTAGTTGTVEPTWPLTAGTTVTDGTAVWTCRAVNCTHSGSVTMLSGNFTGFTGTFTSNSTVNIAANMTMSSTMTFSGATSSTFIFSGVGTLITAGKTPRAITVNGASAYLTLGDALALTGSNVNCTVTTGTLDTAGYTFSPGNLSSNNANTRTIKFGASTVNITIDMTLNTTTNLTFDAGTSQINLNISAGQNILQSGGLTFYNVSFLRGDQVSQILGANTFNNLTFTTPTTNRNLSITVYENQTINGTLTFGTANTAVRRLVFLSSTTNTQRSIVHNGTLASMNDVDFRDIAVTGTASPWTGTRIGDGGGLSGITTSTPKTVYWNLAGTQNWSATGWATTNNGTPAVNNFPLAQDTATFTDAGSAGTITMDSSWWIGSIQMADGVSNRTTAFTLTSTSSFPQIHGNVTLFSNLTLSGTSNWSFYGRNTTQTITSAGKTIPYTVNINCNGGTFKLGDAFTLNAASGPFHNAGTIDLNGNTWTSPRLSCTGSSTKAIAFGTSQITLTGNNGTILTLNDTGSSFTATGTVYFNSTYTGATGTRTFSLTLSETAANTFANVATTGTSGIVLGTTATDIVALTGSFGNVDLTGFTNTLSNTARTIYGDLKFPASGGTFTAGTSATTFGATSGVKKLTTNGRTLDFPLTMDGVGGTIQLQDNCTLGSTRAMTLTNGTLDLTGGGNWTLTASSFFSYNSNARVIAFGTGQITLTGNATTIWDTAPATNLSYTGTFNVVSNYSGATGTRTFYLGAFAIDIKAAAGPGWISFGTSGTDIVAASGTAIKTIDTTGFAGSFASATRSLTGDLIIGATTTLTSSLTTTFIATSGVQKITTNGKTLDFPIVINGAGGTVQPQENITVGATRTTTLTAGTLDLTGNSGNWTWSTGAFSSDNSNARSIIFGTGKIVLTSTSNIWNAATSTNLSYTGTSRVESNSTFGRTITHGSTAGDESSALSFYISGSNTVTTTSNSKFKNLDFSGFTGTLANNSRTIYGDLYISSGMTLSSLTTAMTFAATSGTQNITSNGKQIPYSIIINAPGATVLLQDAINCSILSHTAGTFDAGSSNVTTARYVSANSNVRAINMGSGTWSLTGSGTDIYWDLSTSTNCTINPGTSKFILTNVTAGSTVGFYGGGLTYYDLELAGGANNTIAFTGSNTFNKISSVKNVGHTMQFEAGSTTNVANWTVDGSSGKVVTLKSSSTSQFTLNKTGGGTVNVNYFSISYSNATPNGTWYALKTNGNTDGGNNTGWIFVPSTGNFLMFF